MGFYECLLCDNKSSNQKVSFHPFPSDEKLKKKWIAFCDNNDDIIKPSSRVCSSHFSEDSYLPWSGEHRELKETAVPSLNVCPSFIADDTTGLEVNGPKSVAVHGEYLDPPTHLNLTLDTAPKIEPASVTAHDLSLALRVGAKAKSNTILFNTRSMADNSELNHRIALGVLIKQCLLQKKILSLTKENRKLKKKISTMLKLKELKQLKLASENTSNN